MTMVLTRDSYVHLSRVYNEQISTLSSYLKCVTLRSAKVVVLLGSEEAFDPIDQAALVSDLQPKRTS